MKIELSPNVQKQLGVEPEKVGISIEEYNEKCKQRDEYDAVHPIRTVFKEIRIFFRCRIWHILDDWKYKIKWGFQRMFRGYDDPFVWSHYYWNSVYTIAALKELKRTHIGHPAILTEENDLHDDQSVEKNSKRWDDLLDQMIAGFEAILEEDEVHIETEGKYDHEKSEIKRKELHDIFEKGMTLYMKYYRHLWD